MIATQVCWPSSHGRQNQGAVRRLLSPRRSCRVTGNSDISGAGGPGYAEIPFAD